MALADRGLESAMQEDDALRKALNVYDGTITHPGVAEALGLRFTPPEDLLG
jgi:alanine dehydrogenase